MAVNLITSAHDDRPRAMSLDYQPENGMLTRKRPGLYMAPDRTHWTPKGGKWVRAYRDEWERGQHAYETAVTASTRRLMACMFLLGFCLGVVCFARLVFMNADTTGGALLGLGAIGSITGAINAWFYRRMGD